MSEVPRSNIEDLSCYWNGGTVERPPGSGSLACATAACPVTSKNSNGCLALPRSQATEAAVPVALEASCYKNGGRKWSDSSNQYICPTFGCSTSDNKPDATCRESNSLAAEIPPVRAGNLACRYATLCT